MLCMLSCLEMNLPDLYIKRAGCIETSSFHQLLQASVACLHFTVKLPRFTVILPPKSCPLVMWGLKCGRHSVGEECVCVLRSAAVLYLAALHQRNLPPLFFTIGTEARGALLHWGSTSLYSQWHQDLTQVWRCFARIHLTNLELQTKIRDIPKIINSFRDTFRSGRC